MKLKVTKTESVEPDTDDKPKVSKKVKLKMSGSTTNQYGKYSGIVNEEGKAVDKPTELEAVKNMAAYMKNNQSPQSDKPSNVYRPEFSHMSILYNRKKKQSNA